MNVETMSREELLEQLLSCIMELSADELHSVRVLIEGMGY